MINTTVSKILNNDDKEYFTLYAEWLDSHFRITLFKPETVPLSGEMNEDEVSYFSRELCRSSDDYLRAAKEAFCGKDKSIKFSVSDTKFEWKREDIWTLGKITLSSVSNVKALSETFRHLLSFHEDIQERLATLENENKHLEEMKTKLIMQIDEMTRIKNTIEHDLYKKFLLVLNTKKRKIHELEDTIKGGNFVKRESAFDACTDQSEGSEEECFKTNNVDTEPIEIGKRKSLDGINGENTRKVRRTNRRNIDSVVDECTDPRPSTSKVALGGAKNAEKNHAVTNPKSIHDEKQSTSAASRKSSSLLNFLEEESEEELFS